MQKDTIELASCPVRTTLKVLGGKWKPLILHYLSRNTYRFGELRREIPEITQKMLTQQLRELEESGVVQRKQYPQVPPKVEYSLSEYGEGLRPILTAMCRWGKEHAAK